MSKPSTGGLLPEAQRAFLEGKYDRAEKWCRLHLASQPEDKEAQTLLGFVLLKTRRVEEAVPLLTAVGTYEAYGALTSVFFARGLVDQALQFAEKAINLDPNELATYNKAAKELVRHGRHREAVEYCRRAVERVPTDLASNQNLAAALQGAGRMADALDAWRRVTEIAPRFTQAWVNLGMLEQERGNTPAVVECGKQAIHCDPSNPEGYVLAGGACHKLGRSGEAETLYRKAVELAPRQALLQVSLGMAVYDQGRFEEAERWFRSSLELFDTNGLAYYYLARSRKLRSPQDLPLIESMESVLTRPELPLLDRSYVEYALGKAYEDLKEFEASMRHYDRANEAAFAYWSTWGPRDPARFWETFRGIREMFSQELMDGLRGQGVNSDLPVLIVGMMRSGTSLLEQILSSHPDIVGAGELTYWEDLAGSACDVQARRLDSARLYELAGGYVTHLERIGKGAGRVVDKNPHNFALLGLIQPALPQARILHIRRDPVDNCLSIYSTALTNPPEFALKRETIVEGYRQYQRLMDHWRATLPSDRFLEVDYEDLVADREAQIRRILDFLGLEWDDRCLEHQKNSRAVHTPSAWQVRQPIYKTSVERWKNYEPWLGEFRSLLPA